MRGAVSAMSLVILVSELLGSLVRQVGDVECP